MASSIPSKKYHVFISFRGEDTRDNFTSHLYDALCRNNIETYIDYRLEKGEKVWSSLEKAIHDSMMFLIVFSENYATSTWCLKELTTILDCSKEDGLYVIPVFYKIDPSHIRKQEGSYKTAFRNHELSNPQEQVKEWKDALTYAANLSGWDSSTYRNDAEFTQQIVKCLLKKLVPAYQDICLEGLVGVKEKVEDIELLMQNSSPDVRFIGIWGMAGIGKTTIAKALFNKLCFSFDSFCFLANVREESKRSGIEHVKDKLLSTLLEDEKSYKGMLDGGSTYVQMRFRQKKVLVVLDDIDNSKQLESLAGAHNWFGQGSRIIITTRDRKVLGPNVDHVYEVEILIAHEALQLFKMKAFEDNCCDVEFESLSLEVVNYASGLPLALTVLGRFLYGEDKSVWESKLEKLSQMPPEDIQTVLRLSYDYLDHEEKEIFLFVACSFKRRSVEHIKSLLDACGLSTIVGLRTLQHKALLTISGRFVYMHDLIKEMGKEIVREESRDNPGKRRHLWDAKDICQILKHDKGSEAIKTITLNMLAVEEDLHLSPQVFSKMHSLLFLEIYNFDYYKKSDVYLPQGLGYLSSELRYLHWDNYPLMSLPSTFSAENLVKLELPDSRMTKLWHGVQNVANLKEINLNNSKDLVELPDFSKAKNLEILELYNCARIREIHPSVLSLNKLESLTLDNCVALTSLKSDTESRSLRILSAKRCSSLKEFSIIAKNLYYLSLAGTDIEEFPSCVGDMCKLGDLSIFKRESRRSRLGYFLDIYEVGKVVNDIRLDPLIGILRIKGKYVDSLPESLPFKDIKQFLLINCTRLRSLPAQLPPSLKIIKVYSCPKLQSLPELPPSLVDLHVSGCLDLQTLLQLPPSLTILRVDDCPNIRYLPELPPSLSFLYVGNCSSLETVQVTSTMDKLYKVEFENCMKLDEHTTKAILANAILTRSKCPPIGSLLCHWPGLEVTYPGSKVPEWFMCKTTHSSVVVDLSSAPLSLSWILLCCVVTPLPRRTNVLHFKCKYRIYIINDDQEFFQLVQWSTQSFRCENRRLSEHVHLWHNYKVCHQMYQIRKGKDTSNSKILLQVEFDCYDGDEDFPTMFPVELKEYGVCPTYSKECQNLLNEMALISQATTSDNEDKWPTLRKRSDGENGRSSRHIHEQVSMNKECHNLLNEMALISQASTSRAGARCTSDNQDNESDISDFEDDESDNSDNKDDESDRSVNEDAESDSSSNYFSFEDSE